MRRLSAKATEMFCRLRRDLQLQTPPCNDQSTSQLKRAHTNISTPGLQGLDCCRWLQVSSTFSSRSSDVVTNSFSKVSGVRNVAPFSLLAACLHTRTHTQKPEDVCQWTWKQRGLDSLHVHVCYAGAVRDTGWGGGKKWASCPLNLILKSKLLLLPVKYA